MNLVVLRFLLYFALRLPLLAQSGAKNGEWATYGPISGTRTIRRSIRLTLRTSISSKSHGDFRPRI